VLGALAGRAEAAGDLKTVVVTFDVHPRSVVVPARAPKMLTTVARRLEIFEQLGIDYVGVLPFDRIRHLPPEEFVRRVVVNGFDARAVMVGRGFRYGSGRAGDVASLRATGEAWGFTVEARRLIESAHHPISSSFIRRCIAEGDMATATRLLGRPHQLPALVTEPATGGTGYGLPSACLEVDRSMAIPRQGVYAGWIVMGDRGLRALCEVGSRTVDSRSSELILIHLLDSGGELGARRVGIRFAEWVSDRPASGAGDDEADRGGLEGEFSVQLHPQRAYVRRLQHLLAERFSLASTSRGREPERSVLIYRA